MVNFDVICGRTKNWWGLLSLNPRRSYEWRTKTKVLIVLILKNTQIKVNVF